MITITEQTGCRFVDIFAIKEAKNVLRKIDVIRIKLIERTSTFCQNALLNLSASVPQALAPKPVTLDI